MDRCRSGGGRGGKEFEEVEGEVVEEAVEVDCGERGVRQRRCETTEVREKGGRNGRREKGREG